MIPYGRQCVDEADIAAVTAALRADFLTTGPQVDAFEADLAAVTTSRHAVVCSSATAALHIASIAMNFQPGDYVIVPALTFLATANAPRLAGAEIWLADVDPDTGLLRPEDLMRAIREASAAWPGRRLRAVYPVHLNGQTCDMVALAACLEKSGSALIEDACHALGGLQYRADESGRGGRDLPVGAGLYSAMSIFSFHPVKTVAMGEGGAVCTNDPALAARLARLRSHGMVRDPAQMEIHAQAFGPDGEPNSWYYEMPEIGLNYRAPDILCALGRSQLAKLQKYVARRRELADLYARLLAPLAPAVMPVARVAHGLPAWHLSVALIDFASRGTHRAAVMRSLRAAGIGSQVHYLPLHMQPYYRRRYGEQALPGAEAYYSRCLSLPLYFGLTEADVETVVGALQVALGL